MSDLIERLREIANDETYCNGRMCSAETWMEGAADCIEAKDKRIEELEARHDKFIKEFWKTNAENEQLRGDLEIMRLQRNATHCSRCPECAKEFVYSHGSSTGE